MLMIFHQAIENSIQILGGMRNLKCRYFNSFCAIKKKTSCSTYGVLPTERVSRRKEWFNTKVKRMPSNYKNRLDIHSKIHTSLRNDPLKLASNIQRLLVKDNFDMAVKIVREASRSIQCVVSWNHLIDWLMSKGKMKAAFKIYQEMKKRGIIPDSHTFTILFRGCAQSPHSRQALGNVMAVYQSMLLDKSPVKPNIIHMNAILKTCAMSGDIHSMLYFMKELPSNGVRAANSITFSTILNALRHNAITRLPTPPSPDQKTKKILEMVLTGRQIWKNVLKRWHKGDIWIDEELVCSMGHLLLTSEDKWHWDEVLTIIEQTMAIPRQLPHFRPPSQSQSNYKAHTKCQENYLSRFPLQLPENRSLLPKNGLSTKSIAFPKLSHGAGKFARPGQNSLSLVLNALLFLSVKEPATKYWKIFTQGYDVEPDLENYVSYLRILRVFRSSTESLQLLNNMPKQYMEAKIFRIAISSCVRDKKNQHAFSNSGKILDLMQMSLEIPDVPTISRYLELAVMTPKFTADSSNTISTLSDESFSAQIFRALNRVQELLIVIKSHIFFDNRSLEEKFNRHEYLVNVEKLIRKLIAGYTHLVRSKTAPDYLIPEFKAKRHELCHLISRVTTYRKSVGAPPSPEKTAT